MSAWAGRNVRNNRGFDVDAWIHCDILPLLVRGEKLEIHAAQNGHFLTRFIQKNLPFCAAGIGTIACGEFVNVGVIGLRLTRVAKVETDGLIASAEVHWYECHGIGKVKMKVKTWL
jgi:hypothetical protein